MTCTVNVEVLHRRGDVFTFLPSTVTYPRCVLLPNSTPRLVRRENLTFPTIRTGRRPLTILMSVILVGPTPLAVTLQWLLTKLDLLTQNPPTGLLPHPTRLPLLIPTFGSCPRILATPPLLVAVHPSTQHARALSCRLTLGVPITILCNRAGRGATIIATGERVETIGTFRDPQSTYRNCRRLVIERLHPSVNLFPLLATVHRHAPFVALSIRITVFVIGAPLLPLTMALYILWARLQDMIRLRSTETTEIKNSTGTRPTTPLACSDATTS